jgi:hypothetical protein
VLSQSDIIALTPRTDTARGVHSGHRASSLRFRLITVSCPRTASRHGALIELVLQGVAAPHHIIGSYRCGELAPIRVNLIAAGFVDTPLSAKLLGDQLDARREQFRTTLPIRRVVGPTDIAALAVHLMTNTAVTGATFDTDGGQQLVER